MTYALGVLYALISAITFGVIPLFSVSLMKQGLHFNNVVFYRYVFAAALIALIMRVMKKSLKISAQDLPLLGVLAFLNVGCSFFLMWGYTFLDSGLATGLYFLYPVFVTVAMMTFFGEKKSLWVGVSIFLAVFGVSLLSGGGGVKSGSAGIAIVLTSALFYAAYIVATNKSKANAMEPLKFTFYALFFGALFALAFSIGTDNFQLFSFDPSDLLSLAGLILFSTVISNVALVGAIQRIGSTMTAIFGALQPLTAVFVGVVVFNEPFTQRLVYATACIIASVILVLISKHLKNPLEWNYKELSARFIVTLHKLAHILRGVKSVFSTGYAGLKKVAGAAWLGLKSLGQAGRKFWMYIRQYLNKFSSVVKRFWVFIRRHLNNIRPLIERFWIYTRSYITKTKPLIVFGRRVINQVRSPVEKFWVFGRRHIRRLTPLKNRFSKNLKKIKQKFVKLGLKVRKK